MTGLAGTTMEETSPYYGYVPFLPVTIIFTTLFTISTSAYCPPTVCSSQLTHLVAIHLRQCIHYRLRYLLYSAVVAGLLEITRWSAHLYSHYHPDQLGQWADPLDCSLFNYPGGDHQTIWTMLQSSKPKALCISFIWKLGARIKILITDAIVFVTADIVALSV